MLAFLENRNYDLNFKAWCCCYRDLHFLPHYHKDVELILVREGTAHIGINNEMIVLEKGDFLICPSGNMHYSTNTDENIMDFIVFDPTVLDLIKAKYPWAVHVIRAKELEETGLASVVERMYETVHLELRELSKNYDALIKLVLAEFYIRYMRLYKKMVQQADKSTAPASWQKIQPLIEHIEKNYKRRITLEEAAKIAGYEPCYFSKVFKKLTGQQFVWYLNNVRVGKAIELIRKSDKSMIDVALTCGFENTRTFNRVFKTVTGETPSEFIAADSGKIKGETAQKTNAHVTCATLSFTEGWI